MSDNLIRHLPLSDVGDAFRPNACPAQPNDEIKLIYGPLGDSIGLYCGHPSSPQVFRRHVGYLLGDKITGEFDAIVCPEMALRVLIPRDIKTWGELAKFLNEKFSTYRRTNFLDRS